MVQRASRTSRPDLAWLTRSPGHPASGPPPAPLFQGPLNKDAEPYSASGLVAWCPASCRPWVWVARLSPWPSGLPMGLPVLHGLRHFAFSLRRLIHEVSAGPQYLPPSQTWMLPHLKHVHQRELPREAEGCPAGDISGDFGWPLTLC